LRTRHSAPILVVGTYRETELGRTRPLAEALADFRRERAFERIALPGLAEEEIFALLERAASHDIGRAGQKLARALSRATDGNPFFIEQIIGHLVDTGRLARRDGVWALDGLVEDLGIPEGVLEAIGRRLSRLSEACNGVLAAASVLGREFEVDLLTRVLARDHDQVVAAIEEALQVGLVREIAGRRASCMFSHALVQQALYEELSLARKQRLHLKAADAIEALHTTDTEPAVRALARHLRAAGAAADSEKTIYYSARAMEAAARVFAFEEAIAHGEAALELIDEYGAGAAGRGRLHEHLGDLWYVAGGASRDRSLAHYEAALHEYEDRDEATKAAKVQIKLGRNLATDNVDNAKALRYLRSAERTLGSDPDPRLAGALALNLAVALNTALEPDGAAEAAARGMEIGRALESDSMWAAGAAIRGGALALLGRFDEARELCDQAWEVADRIDNALAGYTAAWMRCAGGRWHPHDHLRLALMELEKPRQHQTLFLRLSLRKLVANGLAHAGEMSQAREMIDDPTDVLVTPAMMLLAGSFSEMERRIVAGIADLRSVGHRWGEGQATLSLGIIQWAAGSTGPARNALETAIDLVAGRNPSGECEARARLAILEASEGRTEEATRQIAACEAILPQGNGWRGCLGLIELARACATAASGRLGEAEQMFVESIDIYRRYGLPFDESEALQLWGRELAAEGDTKRALEKYDEALQIYTSRNMGKAWIDRVHTAHVRVE
jgi:tetratricopeptide (TPR) repeat protein